MSSQLNSRTPRLFVAVSTMLTVLMIGGCGPEPDPVGIIAGKVTSGDTAIGDCKIAIKNSKTLISKAATVDETGNFRMEKVPFGEYDVIVYSRPSYTAVEFVDKRIPKKATSFATSGFAVTVDSTEETVLNVDLKK